MLTVNQSKMAELLNVTAKTIIMWEKENGFPVIRQLGKAPEYPVKKCFQWRYKEDWEYFFNKMIG